jgi:hypothetical protein
MLLIYLPALIFEGFCEMLLEPMRAAERQTRGNRELSAGLGDPAMRPAPVTRLTSSRRDLA